MGAHCHYHGVCDCLVLMQRGRPSSAAGGAGLLTHLSALWEDLIEEGFSSCLFVAGKGEKLVVCSRSGKPRRDFGNVVVFCLLKSMEMRLCLFMPEDLY